jgi:hypothetical protein
VGNRAVPRGRRGAPAARGRFLKTPAIAAVALTVVGVAAAGQPKKVIVPAIQAKARAINVQRSDLPGTGWTAHPSANQGQTPTCSYYNPDQSDLTENGDVDSPEFTLPSGSYVSSTNAIFVSAQQGRTAYARVVQPLLPKCLAEVFRKGTGKAAKVTIVSSAAIPWPLVADRTNAYRIVADFKVAVTQAIRVTIEVVAMNRGKVDAVVFFAGIGQQFAAAFERGIVAKVAARTATVH